MTVTAEDLKAWRKRLGFRSQAKAAEAIGCSPRAYTNYEGGREIPKYIALACAAVSLGVTDFPPTITTTPTRLSEQRGDLK